MTNQRLTFAFEEKLTNLGFLESVIGDLEVRLDCYHEDIKSEESLEQRIETMENHVKVLRHVVNWHHDLWDRYALLVKKENEKLNF